MILKNSEMDLWDTQDSTLWLDLPANIRQGGRDWTVTNPLAYPDTESFLKRSQGLTGLYTKPAHI